MAAVLSGVQGDLSMAVGTAENIKPICAAPDWLKDCDRFVFDPTTGTVQIAPAYRDKFAKALIREVRRMKLRLYLTFARLYLQKFVLECRGATARVHSYFLCQIGQFGSV
jgi:hypothetical protein